MPKQRRDDDIARRRGRSIQSLRRTERPQRERITLLIVCEGEKTEFHYLQSLKEHYGLPTLDIEVSGGHRQALTLVREAIRLREQRAHDNRRATRDGSNTSPPLYDEIWCVFDREGRNEPPSFSDAVHLLMRERFQSAISNPCIEYWYLLHFIETDAPLVDGRTTKRALAQHIEGYTEATDAFIYLRDRTYDALKRSERITTRRTEDDPFPDPSTQVGILVDRIVDQAKVYQASKSLTPNTRKRRR